MRMIIVGPPGGGKGTQAKNISEELNIPHISTGDIFRKNISEGTELGKKAKSYMDEGKLVPDQVTIDMIRARLSEKDCSEGFLLDGFPRTLKQAEELDNVVELDLVLDVEVPDDVCVERIVGRASEGAGRSDDNEETAKRRLDVFHEQTEPILEHYSNKGIVKKVDGNREIKKVWEDIKRVINA